MINSETLKIVESKISEIFETEFIYYGMINGKEIEYKFTPLHKPYLPISVTMSEIEELIGK